MQKSAAAYDAALKKENVSEQKGAPLNQYLKDMERRLTREQGLPRRPWYKHHIYAPGFYTGYGVKTLPGVREAIEERNFVEAQEQIDLLGNILAAFSDGIGHLTGVLLAK